MKFDEITEETIKTLVNEFYQKVRNDKNLGPVFNQVIGESSEEWAPHLQQMYNFWSSLMLTSGRYSGNPMKKHMDIPKFSSSLFDKWLELFAETAKEIHTNEIANKYIIISHRVAENLKMRIYANE